MRFIRDGEKGEGGVEMGGGRERESIPIATLSPPEWAAMRASPGVQGVVKYRPGQAETAVRDGENFGHLFRLSKAAIFYIFYTAEIISLLYSHRQIPSKK